MASYPIGDMIFSRGLVGLVALAFYADGQQWSQSICSYGYRLLGAKLIRITQNIRAQRKIIRNRPKFQKAFTKRTSIEASTPQVFSHTAGTRILRRSSLSGSFSMDGPAGCPKAITTGQVLARLRI